MQLASRGSSPFVSLLREQPVKALLEESSCPDSLEELAEAIQRVDSQCLRLYEGESVVPAQMFAMQMSDPEMARAMLERMQKGERTPLAKIMVRDVYRTLARIEQEEPNGIGWLERVRPDWKDAVALARSLFVSIERGDIPAMKRCSEQCGSSVYSFAVLVTLMRAVKFDEWEVASQMWRFKHLPRGSRLVAGVMPEIFWEMKEETLDELFQPMQTCTVESGHVTDCAVCLEEMSSGETVRLLRCGHRFHTDCISEWIEAQWGEISHIYGEIDNLSVASCPICRTSTGV